jgi:hypothetical protein
MHVRKLIQAHLRQRRQGIDVAADVNAVIDANVLHRRRRTRAPKPQTSTTTKEET